MLIQWATVLSARFNATLAADGSLNQDYCSLSLLLT